MERLHLPSSSPSPSFRGSAYIWHLHFSFFAWGLLFGTNFVKKEVSFCKIGSQKNCCSQIMDKVLQEEAEKKSFHQNFNRSKRNFLFFKKNRFESKNPLKSNFFPEKFCMPHCKLTISRKKILSFLAHASFF